MASDVDAGAFGGGGTAGAGAVPPPPPQPAAASISARAATCALLMCVFPYWAVIGIVAVAGSHVNGAVAIVAPE